MSVKYVVSITRAKPAENRPDEPIRDRGWDWKITAPCSCADPRATWLPHNVTVVRQGWSAGLRAEAAADAKAALHNMLRYP